MATTSDIDNFIQTAGDEFTRIYQTVNPPTVPAVQPIVYATSNPAGTGGAIGFDTNSLVLIGVVVLAVWYLLRK